MAKTDTPAAPAATPADTSDKVDVTALQTLPGYGKKKGETWKASPQEARDLLTDKRVERAK